MAKILGKHTGRHDYFLLRSFAAHGATNIAIPYYSTVEEQTSNGIVTMDNSSTLGLSFTAVKRCKVTMSANFRNDSNNVGGISLNSTQLSTVFDSINAQHRVALTYTSADTDANLVGSATCSVVLEPGDVLRPHAAGNAPNSFGRMYVSFLAEEI